MKMTYCPSCGKLLTKKEIGDEGLVPYCETCHRPFFNVMYPCVLLLVLNEKDEVCVISQSYGKGNFVLVAGFVKFGQTLEETIQNEVKEEINQEVLEYHYIKSYYQERNENLMMGFLCRVKEGEILLSSELKSAHFYPLKEAKELLKEAKIASQLVRDYELTIE